MSFCYIPNSRDFTRPPLSIKGRLFIIIEFRIISNIFNSILANKMDTNNMAIVIGPNIVVNNPDKSTDYSIVLTEMEMTQRMGEMMIIHVSEVFEDK